MIFKNALFVTIAILVFLFGASPPVFAQPVVASLPSPSPGAWVVDKDVTFAGKNANRASELLDWVLLNYQWSSVKPNQAQNSLGEAHAVIRSIAYAVLTLFILATAFLLIITRGQNITLMRFIPRFLLVVLLVTIAYGLVQFLYQIADIIQGFFLQSSTCASGFICRADLLNIQFDYRGFMGYRRFGFEFDESAFVSTLLVKLTALTYFVMSIILLLRKVILWFFIILAPIFPLLLIFSPIRNTGKIWLGEFFRWLLYAPLFAMLLSGLVLIWKGDSGIPLNFQFGTLPELEERAKESDPLKNKQSYYTAINILLGGPKQQVTENNSLNVVDTFAQYFIALLMLWMVIILPFILLKIFLDFITNISISRDNALVNYIATRTAPVMGRYGFPGVHPPTGGPPPPSSIKPTGQALPIPIYERSLGEKTYLSGQILTRNTASERVSNVASVSSSTQSAQTLNQNNTQISEADREILTLTNLSVPTMTDIVRYETQMLSSDTQTRYQLSQMTESLRRLSRTSSLVTPREKEHYSKISETVSQRANAGSVLANSIIKASQVQAGGVAVMQAGVASGGGGTGLHVVSALPAVNSIQKVSLDDYEIVKKMWKENFQKLTPPIDTSGREVNRKTWVHTEMRKIQEAINLLSSPDPEQQKKGQEIVGQILPFLLLGGFSKEEIIAYLKAKLEAGRSVAEELAKEEEDEASKLPAGQKHTQPPKEMSASVEVPVKKE